MKEKQETRTKKQTLFISLSETVVVRGFFILLITTMLSCLSFCTSPIKKDTTTVSVTDGTGRIVTISEDPQTIMALSPSMTEVLFALNLKKKIVGRTNLCNYPKECLDLPEVTVYPTVGIEQVLQIKPDIIVSNVGITPPEIAEKLSSLGIPVVLYDVSSIDLLYESIISIAKVMNSKQSGDSLVGSLKNIVSESQAFTDSKKCLALISIDPIYVHGQKSFLNDVLHSVGFKNMVDSSMGSYPQLSREYILKKDPEYFIGYNFEYLDSTFFMLYPELRALSAYKNKAMISLDQDLSSRPSPRFVQLFNQLKVVE